MAQSPRKVLKDDPFQVEQRRANRPVGSEAPADKCGTVGRPFQERARRAHGLVGQQARTVARRIDQPDASGYRAEREERTPLRLVRRQLDTLDGAADARRGGDALIGGLAGVIVIRRNDHLRGSLIDERVVA